MRAQKMLVVFAVAVAFALSAGATPLDDYVAAPDPSYRYDVIKTITGSGYTAYVIDLKSQTWRKESEVDRTLWQHWLTIVKPDQASHKTGFLWINGGRNGGSPPTSVDNMLVQIATMSKTVVADLRMVPNQPLVFPDDGRQRSEDAIIAYTFDKFLKTEDPTWPLLLPMVKSAVRAMDTVQSHLASEAGGSVQIDKFVVSGGSKRGWTTWLTAAVDKRVAAIVPAVIDVLNMGPQMRHHFAAYGFYSPAIGDYEQMKIFDRLDSTGGTEIRNFVDPYEYRDRYAAIPKFMVNSPGDQFFLPDSAQFYFHDLPGEKYIRYVPNTDHGLGGSDAPMSLLVFCQSILTGSARPKFTWSVAEDHSIVVKTVTAPTRVNLWQATNPDARDFRLEKIGKVWTSSPLTAQGDGTYVAKVPEPEKGWTAFFVELVYSSGTLIPFKFTTEVHVVPDRLPYEQKLGFDTGCDMDSALAAQWQRHHERAALAVR